ncbi:protein Vms1p [[Candida] anglica]
MRKPKIDRQSKKKEKVFNQARVTFFHSTATNLIYLAITEMSTTAPAKPPAVENLYLYNLQPKIAESLELMYFDSSVSVVVQPSNENSKEVSPSPENIVKPGHASTCTSCAVEITSPEERRNHYKSDFHRFNIKRSIEKLDPVSEEEFENLIEGQSIESLSGSDASSDEENDEEEEREDKLANALEGLDLQGDDDEENVVSHLNTKSAFMYLRSSVLSSGKVFGIYKCLFSPQQLLNSPMESLLTLSQPPVKSKKSALFMIGGGHFAGAIISHIAKNTRGNPPHAKETRQEQAVNVIVSKTFHRYTTRRKQGGSQSANDNGKGKAVSAGSSIRRYNEQALIKDVRELLTTWKQHLSECEFIFIRANGPSNRKIMVGYEGCEITNNDPRLRTFPFTTKRATATELKRAWAELSYLHVVDTPKEDAREKRRLQQRQEQLKNSQVQHKKEAEAVISPQEKHTSEIISILKKSKAPLLINYLKKNKLSPDFPLEPKSQYIHNPTLTHYAAAHGLTHMVQILLVNLKADPTIESESHKTPAELSANPATRKAFQIARYSLGEDYCDWKAAKVGAAKSKEEFLKEEQAEQDLVSQEKKRLIQEELAKKTELELKAPRVFGGGILGGSITQSADMNKLSDQQKMRIMREQRARAAEARLKGN